MLIFETDNLPEQLDEDREGLWVYNGFDNLITYEVFEKMREKLEPETSERTYNRKKNTAVPALTMMRRGFKIDLETRDTLVENLNKRLYALGGMERNPKGKWEVTNEDAHFQVISIALTGKPINYNSDVQLKRLFHDRLSLPPYHIFEKGKKKVSVNKDALESYKTAFVRARPFVNLISRIRDIKKQLDVLETKLDFDNRMRCNFNVVGTETGRWASRTSVFNTGTNLQNIRKSLREIFIPDEGYTMFYADLKNAESFCVGYLSGDEEYINACKTGDIHTYVAKLCFPELEWTGDLAADKKIAETEYIPHFSYRDMCKRAGHGTNYYGTAPTVARTLKIAQAIAYLFQAKYYGGEIYLDKIFRWGFQDEIEKNQVVGEGKYAFLRYPGAFPKIREWHENTREELQTNGFLITPLGMKRQFWGRLRDDATLREAIAFKPQSLVGEITALGCLNFWHELEGKDCQLLGQVHDAIVGQIRVDAENDYTQAIKDCMEMDVEIDGRTMRIPTDINFGSNWKEVS